MRGRLTGWYEALGWRYVLAVLGFTWAATMLFGTVTVVDGLLFFGEAPGDHVGVVAVTLLGITVGDVVGFVVARHAIRDVVGFLRAEPGSAGDPVAAWETVTALPARLTKAAAAACVVLTVPGQLLLLDAVDGGLAEALTILLASVVAIAATASFTTPAITSAIRPAVVDVARRLPVGFSPPSASVALRRRMLVGLSMATAFTALTVASTAGLVEAPAARLALALGVALVATATLALVAAFVVTGTVLDPVDELRDATRRVAAGDLGGRIPVLAPDELGALGASFNQMLDGLGERRALQEALGAYVSPDLASRVLRDGVRLDGEELEVTVLMLDLRGFTTMAEQISPTQAVAFLNGFFELVVPVLEVHGGHVVSFVGDGVLSVFGTPRRVPDHAAAAVEAACEVCDAVDRRHRGEVRIGIGIASGTVLAGAVGGGTRLALTVIGDVVNLASRLQELTKETGDLILLDARTHELLGPDGDGLARRGAFTIRGRGRPVEVLAVPALGAPAAAAGRGGADRS